MNKHFLRYLLSLGLLVSGIIAVNRIDNASAKEINIQVSPASFEYSFEPGETISGEFTFTNRGDTTIDYEAKSSPYQSTADDNGGQKVDYETENNYTQISKWVTFSDNSNGTLNPGEDARIKFTISVPKDVPAGGQYTALLVNSKASVEKSSNGTDITENASIGPVVYAKVNGATRETAEIIKNDMDGFIFNPPITVNSIVKNTGNVHAEATYIMRVFPFFGSESIYNNEENPSTVMVLPEATRYYNLSWDGAPAIGIYKVQSEVKIFDQVSKIEKIVIICPMWVLILIGVFILAVIFWIISRAKSRKKAEA